MMKVAQDWKSRRPVIIVISGRDYFKKAAFVIAKALSQYNAAQLDVPITGESLRHLALQRYRKRCESVLLIRFAAFEVRKSQRPPPPQAQAREQFFRHRIRCMGLETKEMRKGTSSGATIRWRAKSAFLPNIYWNFPTWCQGQEPLR